MDNEVTARKKVRTSGKKCKCRPDPSRMFDCDCGTGDSYCLYCLEYLPCQLCAPDQARD